MSEQQKLLVDTAIKLPDDAIKKILDYIVSLGFNLDESDAPEHLIIKDKKDLIKKLEEGMNDPDEISFEEFTNRMDKKISQ